MTDNPPYAIGDIILFQTSGTKSANTAAQSLIRRRPARHSHVAIAVNGGNAIHATTNDGVRLEGIRKLLADERSYVVFRNKTIQHNDQKLSTLFDGLLFYARQKYNYLILIKSKHNASFCSELAAKAYRKIGINLCRHKPQRTLPSDIFESLSRNRDWEDVTNSYSNFYLTNKDHGSHDLAATFLRALEEMNQNMAFGQQKLIDRITEAAPEVGKRMNSFRHYWNNNPRKTGIRLKVSLLTKIVRPFRKDS